MGQLREGKGLGTDVSRRGHPAPVTQHPQAAAAALIGLRTSQNLPRDVVSEAWLASRHTSHLTAPPSGKLGIWKRKYGPSSCEDSATQLHSL